MDKSLFISMNGAQNSMHQLEVITNNLANVNTSAFKADLTYVDQYKVPAKQGQQSRTYSKLESTYTNFDKGPLINTQRDLDIALDGAGFIAVQSKTGKEAYTRAGNLELSADGMLVTQSGNFVIGNGGPIYIPPAEKISISPDGTISARLMGQQEVVQLDRIKLVNPSISTVRKGEDTLFYVQNDGVAAQDFNVKIVSGALEGSNVNAIQTMTQLIELSRHYQIHTNFMKTLADNTTKSNQILELSR